MDAVRAALRLGAEKAMIIYRRGESEIPARQEEVRHAKEEGAEFLTLHNPLEYIADENGLLKAVRVQRMELGEPDESGRCTPVPVEGDIIDVEVDMAVVCVGFLPNPPVSLPDVDLSRNGNILVDGSSMKSSSPEIYAGGDIVRGAATVILAMGDGRKAAKSMAEAFEQIIRNTRLD